MLLCNFFRKEEKEISSTNLGTNKRTYLAYKYPQKDQCIKKDAEISFQKGHGWTSPCNHLKTCICHGDLEELHKIYSENLEKKQHKLSDFFTPIVRISRNKQEMFEWVKLILEESLPVYFIKK